MKIRIQESARAAAHDFFELQRDETGHGRCGACDPCQESLANLSLLFKKAMERELMQLAEKELEREFEIESISHVVETPPLDTGSPWMPFRGKNLN